ncbi:MAG: 16S rRNA (cytidine(1402)-2'-O)-methyltransferase [Bacteroidia bacterium]|nr:16S rRNA (cytidine(1402)-2'-O)-methyltransferase [Bacteroidia bacterium]
MTLRGIRILKECDGILAEDTRVTVNLLKHFEIGTPMTSFHAFNEHRSLDAIIQRLQSGEVLAMVSDAGTPGISDPAFLLVRECIRRNIPVECLPGATAFVPALVQSGLPCDEFIFAGFLPVKKGRKTALEELAQQSRTVVVYESPHRIVKTLTELVLHFGEERQACVCRELSKLHEEVIRGPLRELITHFTDKTPKGELVVLISGVAKRKKNAEEKE